MTARGTRSPFSKIVADLSRLRGVLGALVALERDGLPVEAAVQVGFDADAIAALATSLHRRAVHAGAVAQNGHLVFVQLEAERGRICVTGRGELLLITLAEPAANVGLVRVAMLTAVRAATFEPPSHGPRHSQV